MNKKELKPQSVVTAICPDATSSAVALETPLALGTPGPFQVIEDTNSSELGNPSEAPRRKYDCINYESCLDLAAALNWDSFTCRGCNQQINNNLVWRAHQAKRHDSIANSLCNHLPNISVLCSESETTTLTKSEISSAPDLPPTGRSKLG